MQASNVAITPTTTVVESIEPCQLFAVRLKDGSGKEQTALCMLMGGRTYFPPNHIQWTEGFRETDRAVRQAVLQHAGRQQPTSVPAAVASDEVAVIG